MSGRNRAHGTFAAHGPEPTKSWTLFRVYVPPSIQGRRTVRAGATRRRPTSNCMVSASQIAGPPPQATMGWPLDTLSDINFDPAGRLIREHPFQTTHRTEPTMLIDSPPRIAKTAAYSQVCPDHMPSQAAPAAVATTSPLTDVGSNFWARRYTVAASEAIPRSASKSRTSR